MPESGEPADSEIHEPLKPTGQRRAAIDQPDPLTGRALRTTRTYENALNEAVDVGGDTDTVTAADGR